MGSKSSSPAIIDDLNFDLSAGWVPTRFREILVELQTGPFGSTLHQSDYEKGGTPVVNPASIQNERIVPIEKMAVGPATLRRLATFRLRQGDIVMGRRGEMGRCAEVTQREERVALWHGKPNPSASKVCLSSVLRDVAWLALCARIPG